MGGCHRPESAAEMSRKTQLDVCVRTTDGRWLRTARYTQPAKPQHGLQLPPEPPPKIGLRELSRAAPVAKTLATDRASFNYFGPADLQVAKVWLAAARI
jgi:hypothetical protein